MYLEAEPLRFRAIWALPGAVALAILSGLAAMPPSPRWILLRATQANKLQVNKL